MIERTLVFGENGGLVGTVCLPATGKGAAVGMVLFNAGIPCVMTSATLAVRQKLDWFRLRCGTQPV